jgi:hypothetical protein
MIFMIIVLGELKNKSQKRIRITRKNSISAFKGTWGQMRKYGSPGKIIYTGSR